MKNVICLRMVEQLIKKQVCLFWVNLSLNDLFLYLDPSHTLQACKSPI